MDLLLSPGPELRSKVTDKQDAFLYPSQALRSAPAVRRLAYAPPATGGMPTQYYGFKVRKNGATITLCAVAVADAPSGMGGVVKVRQVGVTRALYLVATNDPNASPVRVRTTTGTKAIRLKT
jgi:hypothetical protein